MASGILPTHDLIKLMAWNTNFNPKFKDRIISEVFPNKRVNYT